MVKVALPPPIGMELESIIKMRLAAAELVEVGAAQAALQPAANSASRTLIFFINFQAVSYTHLDGQKSQPQRLIGTIPAYIRGDEDDECDDDRSTRYPEPYAFLSEDAHLSGTV